MSKRVLIIVVAAALALAGGVAGNSAYGGSTPVNWTVAGTIVNVLVPDFTAVPPAPPFKPGFLIHAFIKGAPGNAQFTVLGFPGIPSGSLGQCGGGPGQLFSPNDMVIMFADLSMIFAEEAEEGGWVCFPSPVGDPVTAVSNMTVTGGTGRFEGATGEFVGEFVSFPVGDSGAVIAETGTIKGWIDR